MSGVTPTHGRHGEYPIHTTNPSQPRPLLNGGIDKQRRAGKYTHPFGGMRQFAEDRAAHSGWDQECLNINNLESRKKARSNLADRISEMYKEEFVKINKQEGKGRPKANNISAAKKTVRMIAERILLSLEARTTQNFLNDLLSRDKQAKKELNRLRHIHNCGRENPQLNYDEIRSIVRDRLAAVDADTKSEQTPYSADSPELQSPEADENIVDIEMIKQAIVEMRADEVTKGFNPKPLNSKWVESVTTACKKLVRESYSEQYVPKTKTHGCKHFTRKNRVLMVCCGTFPVCRMCHIQDRNRIHDVRIEPVHTMLCMMCGEVQSKTQYCRKCKVCFGSYYCDICGITDDTRGYDLRHCDKCNFCMPGLTFHCDRCKSCVQASPEHDALCNGVADQQDNNVPEPNVSNINHPPTSMEQPMGNLTNRTNSQIPTSHPDVVHTVPDSNIANLSTSGDTLDQSIEHLTAVEARGNPLFSV